MMMTMTMMMMMMFMMMMMMIVIIINSFAAEDRYSRLPVKQICINRQRWLCKTNCY
jgi:hypothetical protein